MVNLTSQDGEEERSHDESTELEPLATDDIDSEESKVVAWEETEGSDDDVAGSELEELAPSVLTNTTVSDLSEHDRLVQVDAVERNIDKEPTEHGTEEDAEVVPFLEVDEELVQGLVLGSNDSVAFSTVFVSISRVDLGGTIRLEILFLVSWGFAVSSLEVLGAVLASEGVLAGLGESQALVEGTKGRDERETDEDTPDLVDVLRVARADVRLESGESDDGDQGSNERSPTLVGEDEAQEGASSVDVGTVRDDGGGHWVVSTDTDTEDDTADEDPDHDLVTREVGWDGDADDGSEDDEDELLAVDCRSTESITKNTETDLTNDASNIGTGLDQVLPTSGHVTLGIVDDLEHGSDLIDDEQIIGIQEETNTSEQDELHLWPGELPWLLVALLLLFLCIVFAEMVKIREHVGYEQSI